MFYLKKQLSCGTVDQQRQYKNFVNAYILLVRELQRFMKRNIFVVAKAVLTLELEVVLVTNFLQYSLLENFQRKVTTFTLKRSNESEVIITVLKTTLGSSLPQQRDWKIQTQEKYENNSRHYTLYK